MDNNLQSSQNVSLEFNPDSSSLDSCPSSGQSTGSSGSSSNELIVKVLSANLSGSRSADNKKRLDKVIKNGKPFNGELQNRRKYYLAVPQLIGVKTVKAVLSSKEVLKEVNSTPGQEADLSLQLEANRILPFTLCVHKGHTILCLELPKYRIKELVLVCRGPSSPGFEIESKEDPVFSEWTLNIKVLPKESSPTTPRKTRNQTASDNSQIDESTCSSPADKPARPTLRVRKVLVLVPNGSTSDLPSYFDCVCTSLQYQKFQMQKSNRNRAMFTMTTAPDIAERVIVVKNSLELYRYIESIATGAGHVLLMATGNSENEVTKPHIVKKVGDLDELTSGVPTKFSSSDAKSLDSFDMLDSNIISNVMKPGSTLWLVPNVVDVAVISEALHLTLTSYPLQPCAQDLYTAWIFKGDELSEAKCEESVAEVLKKRDPGLSQVEITCRCCIAVIVRSDTWLWPLIDMMDDSDFASLGPAFKSVRQIDVRDVEEFLHNPENDIYFDELTALEQRIQASTYPYVEYKMRRDVRMDDSVQIPLKRSSESTFHTIV